jgi:cholesterol transport system auxiliary component
MMKGYRFFPIFILVILGLSACAKLQRSYPERNYYILSVADNNNPNKLAVYSATLEVDRLQISPSFSGREFVYRKGQLSYESDFYNQFFRSPVLLITDEVIKYLSRSGPFQHVVDSTTNLSTDFTLQGNISELYGDLRTRGAPKAVLGMQFFLIDDRPTNPVIVFQNNYRREIALSSNSSSALVEGWNEALQQILTVLEEDLRKVSISGVSSR